MTAESPDGFQHSELVVDRARRHAESAMTDLREETGDDRSEFYTRGLTNWIPTLVEDIANLVGQLEAVKVERDGLLDASSVLLDEVHLLEGQLEAMREGHGGYHNVAALGVRAARKLRDAQEKSEQRRRALLLAETNLGYAEEQLRELQGRLDAVLGSQTEGGQS